MMIRHWSRLVVATMLLALLSGCINLNVGGSRRGEYMPTETLVDAEHFWTTDQILLISLDGVLSVSSPSGMFASSVSPVTKIKDALQRAEDSPWIKAVLLRIDSPGGTVTASDIIYNEILRFKERTGKPVVAICMGVAASGGYYAAMAADKVYVHPTTITGSMSVISIYPNLEELGKKIGVGVNVIKSGEFKDTGAFWRSMTSREEEILQEMNDSMHERFIEVIEEGRPKLTSEKIRELADGRVYNARQAMELGLIDGICYMEEAFDLVKREAGLDDADLVTYKLPGDYLGHYYAASPAVVPSAKMQGTQNQLNLMNINLNLPNLFAAEGPFYYMWMP